MSHCLPPWLRYPKSSYRLAQNNRGRRRRCLCRRWMRLTQTRDLQQCFASARQKANQIAFFGSRLTHERRPLNPAGPARRRRGRRKVYFRSSFDAFFPFFIGNIESDLFKSSQQTDNFIVELQLAIVAILVGGQRRRQRCRATRVERRKQSALQSFPGEQRMIDVQVRQ